MTKYQWLQKSMKGHTCMLCVSHHGMPCATLGWCQQEGYHQISPSWSWSWTITVSQLSLLINYLWYKIPCYSIISNSRCPKTITLDVKKCQGDIMASMKDRIPPVAGKGEAGRPKTAYFLVTFCNFFKIRSLGRLSSVGFWTANVILSYFRSPSWGTGSCFCYCYHCQWSGKTGKLKVTSDYKVSFCKVRCTLKPKAGGPRSLTSGRGLTSKSIQKLQCRSKERKVPKSLGNETSGGPRRRAEGFCSADRLFSRSFLCGFPWGALD